MNIGLVVPGDLDQCSGGYRYDRKLVSSLESRGDDVTVCSLSDGEPTLNQPFDVLLQDELCSPTLVDRNAALEKPGAIVALVHLLKHPAFRSSADQKHERNHERKRDHDHERKRDRRYLESVDAAVCTSEFTREQVSTIVTTDLPTHVAPPAGRQPTPPPSPDDVVQRARTGSLRLVFVGNVIPRKNVETLLDALSHIDRTVDWTLTIVGDDAAKPDYTRQIRDQRTTTGLADRVSFSGPVTDDVLESILACSHVLVVPSRYESFGMVYLEAMEAGVVPIASSVGGASEFVSDGTNGFVVDPEDTERIATIVSDLAHDRERLASLATAALRTADAHPSWETTFEKLRAFLLEISDPDGDESSPSAGGEQP
ncbi:putative glycosyltransferase, type 1 [Natrialba magadii ATCC 43099]|uniref:Glycosyltransferase, type 1 n=1 Tax=Natrialba magadii (strain ATCC 43099 / DSM 3394 / CCM 3739 / CIP 104546 / IAM 13178 / JCM 8861 / NBRC 102185 / NCIMB 2190 / MS3) TaxID=547559 RepID=D3STX3_NATMM|nr:glycosyltransferase family 4 protein [Natrialba magadii]ADD07062.1 putative glycosyltransferase, type 1 [Natrialba magadii ATCC 43099]ELY28795.1 group 1 glycosyl transferase [Natrialba magadii ATCC 43099]